MAFLMKNSLCTGAQSPSILTLPFWQILIEKQRTEYILQTSKCCTCQMSSVWAAENKLAAEVRQGDSGGGIERDIYILKHNLKLKVPPVSSDISAGIHFPYSVSTDFPWWLNTTSCVLQHADPAPERPGMGSVSQARAWRPDKENIHCSRYPVRLKFIPHNKNKLL